MEIGMLWFDNDNKTDILSKVVRAAAYYQTKYGKKPDLCFVHPTMLKSNGTQKGKNGSGDTLLLAGDIEVRTTPSVLPNHLWIGVSTRQVPITS
jgi:hypothetical protein